MFGRSGGASPRPRARRARRGRAALLPRQPREAEPDHLPAHAQVGRPRPVHLSRAAAPVARRGHVVVAPLVGRRGATPPPPRVCLRATAVQAPRTAPRERRAARCGACSSSRSGRLCRRRKATSGRRSPAARARVKTAITLAGAFFDNVADSFKKVDFDGLTHRAKKVDTRGQIRSIPPLVDSRTLSSNVVGAAQCPGPPKRGRPL